MKSLSKPKFSSFIMGGFECNAALVSDGAERLNDLCDTKHDVYCEQDYKLLKNIGIETVREGLLWSQIDKGKGRYDFLLFEKIMETGKKLGIQQIWDLNHFDYPPHLKVYSNEFISSFAKYAVQSVKTLRKYISDTLFIVPVNEISFYSFMGGTVGGWAPFGREQGLRFKKQLVLAALEAMKAIKRIDNNVRFIHVDPLMERKAINPKSIIAHAMELTFSEARFQAFDMISGRSHPELGGAPEFLDIIGLNHYPSGQEYIIDDDPTDLSSYKRINFKSQDWTPLSKLLYTTYARYHRPLIISETGAWGTLRKDWWKMIFTEIENCLKMGIPLYGVCAYPAIDRRDWGEKHLTNSGLWDFKEGDSKLARIPHNPTISIIESYSKKKLSDILTS